MHRQVRAARVLPIRSENIVSACEHRLTIGREMANALKQLWPGFHFYARRAFSWPDMGAAAYIRISTTSAVRSAS